MLFPLRSASRKYAASIVCVGCLVPVMAFAAHSEQGESDSRARSGIEEVLVEAPLQKITDEVAEAAKIPGGVTVVDTGELRQQSLLNMADMLRYVPGVWAASSSGGQGVFYTSRGSNLDATDYDDNGIKLLQDGLPVTTADGNNHNRAIDPLSALFATVARGANALSYGASTLGGAINFTTPTGKDMPGTSVRLNGGSHDLASARVTVAGSGQVSDGLLTLESSSWGGYRDHNQESRHGMYANTGWLVNDQLTTRFYATWLDNDQELSGALTREQFKQDANQANPGAERGDYQLNVKTWRLANRTSWQVSESQRWEFGVSLEEQSLYHPIVDKVLVDFDGPGPMAPVEVFSLLIDTDHRDVGAMVRFNQSLDAHEISAGINYGRNSVEGGHYRNDGGQRNGLSNRIDNQAETWEWFVQDQWSLSDQLQLTLAVQGVAATRETESVNVSSGGITNPDGSYHAINPRIGALWKIVDDVSIYANISRLYEPPTNFELQDDVRGSDEPLDAMHGVVFEVGARGSQTLSGNDKWYWDTAFYYSQVRDEILSRDDPAAPGTSLASNVEKTIHAGVEALVRGQFHVGEHEAFALEPVLSLTLNHFRFDGDPVYGDNDLPAAPDYSVRGELMIRHASGYYIGPVIDLVGERWADFSNTYQVDSYQLLGLRGGYEARGWRVFVELQNLLEEDYVATVSVRDKAARDAAILNPGVPLSVYAGLEFTF